MSVRCLVPVLLASIFALLGVAWLWRSSHDQFAGHHLGMKADRSSYSPGDAIRLEAIVTPTRPTRIRVYRDRQKSFCVFLRRATGARVVDQSDNDFLKCTDPVDTDSTDSVAISPDAPFVLEIEGRLIARSNGKLLFDFGPFGSFLKDHGPQFLVGGYWRPIRPPPGDSLEDYTDKVLITVEK